MAAIAVAVLGAVPVSAASAKPAPTAAGKPHVMRPLGSSQNAAGVRAAGPSIGTGKLLYGGGPVQHHPSLFLDFWGARWTDGTVDAGGYTGAAAQSYITAFVADLTGSAWFASQTQYCDGVATGAVSCGASNHVGTPSGSVGIWNHTTAPVPTEDGVRAEADAARVHFNIAPGTTEATVVVLTPTGQSFFGPNGLIQFCGYHTITPDKTPLAYIPWEPDAGAPCATNLVNPTNDTFGHGHFDGFSIVVGHEIVEAATDPIIPMSNADPFGWLDIEGFESGDKCQVASGLPATNVAFGTGSNNSFAVQPLWSNSTSSCPTEDLGGGTTGHPAIASWASDNRDAFVRGFDGALYTRRWSGSGWSGWSSLGGFLASDPAAVSWGVGRTDVFAEGGDGALWHIAWSGGAWTGWQSLGGRIVTAPAAASWMVNGLDVAGVGLDGAMWHQRWNGSAWSGWRSLGGGFTSGPAAVSWRDGTDRVDIFARGLDNQLWQNASTASSSSGWLARGGGFLGAPALASTAAGRLQVYGIGLDGGLWLQSWTGSAWTVWDALGGSWGGDPPAGSNTVELAMVGVNRNTELLITGP